MFRKEQMYQVIRNRQRNQNAEVERLEVPLDEFAGRARERRIYTVTEFCKTTVFEDAGYEFDSRRGVISRAI
jgi:hypothetical protein